MRTKHGDKFNHDDEAHAYDAHVLKEEIPYRTGYQELLNWVAEQVNTREARRVLDLGTGTGNLAQRLTAAEITGVDNSARMLAIARDKLDGQRVRLIQSDILSYFENPGGPFDTIVSTYALHHLTPEEKSTLFRACHEALTPDGLMVFGDLMFETEADQHRINTLYRAAGLDDMVDEAEEEFYWILNRDLIAFDKLGYDIRTKQFSTLAWTVRAERTRP